MNYQAHLKHTDFSSTGGLVVQLISLRKWQKKSYVTKYVKFNFLINSWNQIQFLVESTFTPLHWLKFVSYYHVYHPESITSEETPSYLCFLLCEENSCTLGHVFFLLHSHTSLCGSSRSQSQKADCHIYPSNHYNSKCSLHPMVISFPQFKIYSVSLSYFDYSSLTYTWDRSMHLLVLWILFENVMSLHRTKASIIGLLEANRVNEWVVTEKLGNTMKHMNNAKPSTSRTPWFRITER